MKTKELAEKYNIDVSRRDVAHEASHLITIARAYAGLSQVELAKRIGTKQSGISRAESGEVEPSISFLDKVARAIGTEFIFHFGFQTKTDTSNSVERYYSLMNKYSGGYFINSCRNLGENTQNVIIQYNHYEYKK